MLVIYVFITSRWFQYFKVLVMWFSYLPSDKVPVFILDKFFIASHSLGNLNNNPCSVISSLIECHTNEMPTLTIT